MYVALSLCYTNTCIKMFWPATIQLTNLLDLLDRAPPLFIRGNITAPNCCMNKALFLILNTVPLLMRTLTSFNLFTITINLQLPFCQCMSCPQSYLIAPASWFNFLWYSSQLTMPQVLQTIPIQKKTVLLGSNSCQRGQTIRWFFPPVQKLSTKSKIIKKKLWHNSLIFQILKEN